MTAKMENNLEIEIEPPNKRLKLDNEWTGTTLTPEQGGSNSSACNEEASPNLQNDNSVLELEDSSCSSSSSSESVSGDSSEDQVDTAGSSNQKSESLDETESSIPIFEDSTAVNKIENVQQNQNTKKSKNIKKSEDSKSQNFKFLKSVKNSGKRKAVNLRKNIKDILKTEHLGEETLAAQREEAERRHRMNLKLQQQQLKLLHQQVQLVRNSGTEESENPFSGLLIEDIVNTIARRKHITVSLDSEDGKFVIKQPNADKQHTDKPEEEIILSSDEETTNQADLTTSNDFYPDFNHQRQNVGMATSREEDEQNVISLSSGDEDEEVCNSEPLQQQVRQDQNNLRNEKPVPVDSDDDCVVISPTPDEDDRGDEKNQDELNIRDEFGRVLVNVGHPDDDPDIFLAPQVAKIVKPHQIGGIRFLYDNVVESVDRFNTSSGFGCILAHSMGLGKTLQAVSFCDIFLRASKAKTVLVIVPINTIQNWLNEFNLWIPSELTQTSDASTSQKLNNENSNNKPKQSNDLQSSESLLRDSISETVSLNLSFDSTLNLNCEINEDASENTKLDDSTTSTARITKNNLENHSDDGDGGGEVHPRPFNVFVLNETVKTLVAREKIITDWVARGGVLLIGYEMYRMLALKKLKKSTRKQPESFSREGEVDILNQIHSCLVDPGPDLVICDEGHRIKNSGASVSQALKAIRTRRRVVLTGYPLQNNLMEYWCMVDFIRPNYLGSKVEFSNMFERPISNGQCVDSTPEDRRLMRFRSHVLHSLLEGFVQRRSHEVLQSALPGKQEWVFLLKMTPIQYKLYKEFIKYLSENVEGQSAANPIKAFAVCCKIWNHPDALYNVVRKKQSILDDLDLDEVNGSENKTKLSGARGQKEKKEQPITSQISYFDGSGFNFPKSHYGSCGTSKLGSENQALSLDWAVPIFQNYKPGVLENGVKLEILFEIIKETVAVKDKLLVFSQTLLSLDLIETFLAQKFNWLKNYQYYRLDGSTSGLEREKLINNFNSKPEVFVFLVSTRAGSLGINLTGANRVVVLDASWNPCHDCQAVCRIYRYGQTKPCQIYRFVSDCTLEKRIYDRQISKRGMSDRVVDEMNPNAQFKSKDVSSFLVLKHDHLDKLPYIKWDLTPEKYSDITLQNVLLRCGDKLTQEPFEHESLLVDQKSQRLSATEKRLAHRNYLNEKRSAELQSSSGYSYNRPSYAAYYPQTKDTIPPTRSLSSAMTNYRQFHLNNEDKFEQHVPALKAKGICVQSIVLKKDSFLADPSGGPDMYLMAGEKVYVLRSEKGTYLRISNGKLIAVRNNSSNSRCPGMNVPATQELTKEQLQGLVYSFLKIPGHHSFTNDNYEYGSMYGDHNSMYPPTEQPLPPSSPSFFSQTKNHLQVTNTRNNSGGDVTLWQPLEDSQAIQHHHHHQPLDVIQSSGSSMSKRQNESSVAGSSKTLSALLDLNKGSTTSFNPNLERLSYLANRFPEFNRRSEFSTKDPRHQSLPNFSPQSHYPYFPAQSYPVPPANGSSSSDPRSEIELIPIRKSTSNGKSSPSRSHLSQNQESGHPFHRPMVDCSGSSYNDTVSNRVSNLPIFEANPSFYKDFTITLKSLNNGNSSGSESSIKKSPKNLCSTKSIDITTLGHKNSSLLNTNSLLDELNTSSSSFPSMTETEPFSQFSQKNDPDTEFSSSDFQNLSQYYSNNNIHNINSSFGENPPTTTLNDSVPTFFRNERL